MPNLPQEERPGWPSWGAYVSCFVSLPVSQSGKAECWEKLGEAAQLSQYWKVDWGKEIKNNLQYDNNFVSRGKPVLLESDK